MEVIHFYQKSVILQFAFIFLKICGVKKFTKKNFRFLHNANKFRKFKIRLYHTLLKLGNKFENCILNLRYFNVYEYPCFKKKKQNYQHFLWLLNTHKLQLLKLLLTIKQIVCYWSKDKTNNEQYTTHVAPQTPHQ